MMEFKISYASFILDHFPAVQAYVNDRGQYTG